MNPLFFATLIATAFSVQATRLPVLLPVEVPPITASRTVAVTWNWPLAVEQSSLTNPQKDELLELNPWIDLQIVINSAANSPGTIPIGKSAQLDDNYCVSISPPITVADREGTDWQSIVMGSAPAIMVNGENDTFVIEWAGSVRNMQISDYISFPVHVLVPKITVGTVQ